MRILLIITAVTFVLGVPFLLWWWKMADMWVSADHRRFHPKRDDTPRVVVRSKVGESLHTIAASNPQTVHPSSHHEPASGQSRSPDESNESADAADR